MRKLILVLLMMAFSIGAHAQGVKISELTEVTSPSSTDVLPIVDAGVTKKVQLANILAALNASNLTSGTVAAARLPTDLSTIVGLSPSNDDVLQRKSGAWTNRTIAQLRSDLGLGRGVFRANRNNVQQTGLTAGAFNKVNLTTENADFDNWFDSATNYRFTPQIAGWYFFNASCADDSVNAGESPILAIYKNGAAAIKGNYVNSSAGLTLSFYVAQASGMIYLNGSTDYVELFIYKPTGTTIDGQIERTFLGGYLVRAD